MADEEFDNMITLTDGNGNSVEMEFLDLIEYDGNEYIVLLPKESDEVIILLVKEINTDRESYAAVEDEDTLSAVFEIFKDKFKDEFNFID